jgi:hypothetical protein
MSQADNAFTILSIVANCVISMSSTDIPEESTNAMFILVARKINSWPVSGDYEKIKSRALSNCKQIEYVLESSALLYNDPCCAARLAQFLLIELRDCTSNKQKLLAIDEMLEYINGVVDIYDLHEKNDAAMNEAWQLVAVIKKQIGMI